MALIPKQNPSPAVVETVGEIMSIYRSLPPRPTIDEVEAAISVVKTVNSDEQTRLDEIKRQDQIPPQDVPSELFSLLQEVRKTAVLFQCQEQRKEAIHLIEVDKVFQKFDELIQKASDLVSGSDGQIGQNEKTDFGGDPVVKSGRIRTSVKISDESLIQKREDGKLETGASKRLLGKSSSSKALLSSGEGDTDKLSLMKVAALIESSAKREAKVVNLQGKLIDQIERLPLSIGKLSNVTELNLSDNQLTALPSSIGNLKALTKLDIHSNQLVDLPDSFGELTSLTALDLHANRLNSLPTSFENLSKLVFLDLGSNQFVHLPDLIGSLTCLKILNVEANVLEDLPYTIGSCTSLVELRLDFNELKALPEAIGKLGCLEILTLHYNRLKGLPTTIGNLTNLKELDVSFNELESITENLCFAGSLVKLNVGKNFADLRALPRSIGNLEMLEELDVSDNQIRVLPDSFRLLSKLRVFCANETPLEVPPRQVIDSGAQAVVQYMANYVAKRNVHPQPQKKRKGFWLWICSLIMPRQRSAKSLED